MPVLKSAFLLSFFTGLNRPPCSGVRLSVCISLFFFEKQMLWSIKSYHLVREIPCNCTICLHKCTLGSTYLLLEDKKCAAKCVQNILNNYAGVLQMLSVLAEMQSSNSGILYWVTQQAKNTFHCCTCVVVDVLVRQQVGMRCRHTNTIVRVPSASPQDAADIYPHTHRSTENNGFTHAAFISFTTSLHLLNPFSNFPSNAAHKTEQDVENKCLHSSLFPQPSSIIWRICSHLLSFFLLVDVYEHFHIIFIQQSRMFNSIKLYIRPERWLHSTPILFLGGFCRFSLIRLVWFLAVMISHAKFKM